MAKHLLVKFGAFLLDAVCLLVSVFYVVAAQIQEFSELLNGLPQRVQIICVLCASFYLFARGVDYIRKD